jgi:hypothetical protein
LVFTEFLMTKFLKVLQLPCFRSRHYEIISMQLYSLRALQKYQECTLISIDFVEFSMKNYSKFSNSYTIGLNITKPPPYYWRFSNCTKNKMCGDVVWGTSIWERKQTAFLDRWILVLVGRGFFWWQIFNILQF